MGVDILDILAVILGVWFTIRKLDAQSRKAVDFPHVNPSAFVDWQKREVLIYQIASLACFAKVVVDLLFTRFVMPTIPFGLARAVAASIDLTWLGLVVLTLVKSSSVRARRRELGIHLGSRPGPGAWEDVEDEDEDVEELDEGVEQKPSSKGEQKEA